MPVMEEKIYTIPELAAHYQLVEETIRRYIRQGKLEAYQFGDTYRVTQSAWEAFLETRKRNKTQK